MVKSRPARTSASGSDLTRFPDCDGMAELVRTGHCRADRGSIGEAQQLSTMLGRELTGRVVIRSRAGR